MQAAGAGTGNAAGGRRTGAQAGPAAGGGPAGVRGAGGRGVVGGRGLSHYHADVRSLDKRVLRINILIRLPKPVLPKLLPGLDNMPHTNHHVDVRLGVQLDGDEEERSSEAELHMYPCGTGWFCKMPCMFTNPWAGKLVTGWAVEAAAAGSPPHITLKLATPTPAQRTSLAAKWGQEALVQQARAPPGDLTNRTLYTLLQQMNRGVASRLLGHGPQPGDQLTITLVAAPAAAACDALARVPRVPITFQVEEYDNQRGTTFYRLARISSQSPNVPQMCQQRLALTGVCRQLAPAAPASTPHWEVEVRERDGGGGGGVEEDGAGSDAEEEEEEEEGEGEKRAWRSRRMRRSRRASRQYDGSTTESAEDSDMGHPGGGGDDDDDDDDEPMDDGAPEAFRLPPATSSGRLLRQAVPAGAPTAHRASGTGLGLHLKRRQQQEEAAVSAGAPGRGPSTPKRPSGPDGDPQPPPPARPAKRARCREAPGPQEQQQPPPDEQPPGPRAPALDHLNSVAGNDPPVLPAPPPPAPMLAPPPNPQQSAGNGAVAPAGAAQVPAAGVMPPAAQPPSRANDQPQTGARIKPERVKQEPAAAAPGVGPVVGPVVGAAGPVPPQQQAQGHAGVAAAAAAAAAVQASGVAAGAARHRDDVIDLVSSDDEGETEGAGGVGAVQVAPAAASNAAHGNAHAPAPVVAPIAPVAPAAAAAAAPANNVPPAAAAAAAAVVPSDEAVGVEERVCGCAEVLMVRLRHCPARPGWDEVRAAEERLSAGPLPQGRQAAARLSLLAAQVRECGEAGDGATAASRQQAARFAAALRAQLGLPCE